MFTSLFQKLKEAAFSVVPIVLIVLAVSFTPFADFSQKEIIVFVVCALFLIVGIALFNLGADMAMTPMGEYVGSGLTKSGNLRFLLVACFAMGLLITIAEPDLSVLAEQVAAVMNGTLLIVTVGVGVGLFLVFAILKIVFKKNLSLLLMLFYMCLFALGALLIEVGKRDFLPLSFDSGGVTTGPITVPFIMALGLGIANTIGGENAGENSFGLIAMCSIGPMLAVLALSIFSSGELIYSVPDYSQEAVLSLGIMKVLGGKILEVIKALMLVVAFFMILEITVLKLPTRGLIKIVVGIGYTFVGLVVFLTSVSVGFMPIGYKLGCELGQSGRNTVVIFGFIIGMVVVLAEPAVHVLNKQVEEITGGTVTKRSMLIALSLGVGISIGLSMLRIVYDFSLLYYLIPGYLLSLALSLFVPGMYTAIAFDSGGVASGPLTSSFILPFAIGCCMTLQGESEILSLAFGIVAMVAMTPLITIQALGFKAVASKVVREKIVMKRILDSDDEQIIYFDVSKR